MVVVVAAAAAGDNILWLQQEVEEEEEGARVVSTSPDRRWVATRRSKGLRAPARRSTLGLDLLHTSKESIPGKITTAA